MPFVPHTDADIAAMLGTIGAAEIDDLFDEIPPELRIGELAAIPTGQAEMDITRLMHARARADGQPLCFIGAGAYDHHIPAAVWQIASRGEFYSAYTPYQAEASQGTLQLLYEFQSMMTALTALDVLQRLTLRRGLGPGGGGADGGAGEPQGQVQPGAGAARLASVLSPGAARDCRVSGD